MTATEQQIVESPSRAGTSEHETPLERLFSDWGLKIGRVVSGSWTMDSIERGKHGESAIAMFSRGSTSLRVDFKRAGSEPYFARIGDIDLSHGKVDAEVSRDAQTLLKRIAAWLKQHEDGAELSALLASQQPAEEQRGGPATDALGSEYFEEPDQQASSDNGGNAAQPYVVVYEAPPLDPAKKCPADKPVLGFDFIHVSDLPKHPDALREIYNGTRGGLVVRGVYSKEEMAKVVRHLEVNGDKFPQMHLPANQRSYFYGLCLEGGDPMLTDYLDSAARMREQIEPAFAGMVPFETRMEDLFGSLAGGRKVQLARFRDGRPYTPATIRVLPPGGQLAPHCGNEMFDRPSYEHLNGIVDNHDQISYFLTLQHPEEGGGLIIYSLNWADVKPDNVLPDGRSNVGSVLAECEWMEVRPEAGDVLMFDGGRWLHRVDWIGGQRTRWTMGGFLMFDRSGETLLYWA